jgi:hypothetical protein
LLVCDDLQSFQFRANRSHCELSVAPFVFQDKVVVSVA